MDRGKTMSVDAAIPVSVVVMTRNEAANIPACLASLSRFDQIFVVDSRSSDATVAIVRRHGLDPVRFDWNGRYPKKKQWCLDTLPFRRDWVLFVDADERVTPSLADELAARFAPPGPPAGVAAFFVDSRPVVLGRRLRFGTRYRKIALIDRAKARFPDCHDLDIDRMWEVEGHYQPLVDGAIRRLKAPLLHDDLKPLSTWFARHDRYSDWEAVLEEEPSRRDAALSAETPGRRVLKRIFRRLPARPLLVFLHAYVLRLGFLDGVAGLHHATGRAFYYWQVSYKRAWFRSNRPSTSSHSRLP